MSKFDFGIVGLGVMGRNLLLNIASHNFAAAGLERINLRLENSIDLDWMLPAPAQGVIMVVCREDDKYAFESCQSFTDEETALCTKIERDFLKELMGGCSTPIGALAKIETNTMYFQGNILSPDGKEKAEASISVPMTQSAELGKKAAEEIFKKGGQAILDKLRNATK